jgi:hypothetical protein
VHTVVPALIVGLILAVVWTIALKVRGKRSGRVLPWALIMLIAGLAFPAFALVSTEDVGPVPWILGGLFTSAGVGGLLWNVWSGRSESDLLRRGIPATAIVESVTDTGWRSFNLRVLKMTLLVHVPGRAPYELRHRARIHDLYIPLIMSGNEVPVLVDPHNAEKILLTLRDGTLAAGPASGGRW